MKKFIGIIIAVVVVMSCGLYGCGAKEKVKMLGFELTNEQYAVAVKKGNTSLTATINEVLAEIKSNGVWDELYAIYTDLTDEGIAKADARAFEAKTESTDKANELIVATSADFPPFEYKLGNKFLGIDLEVAKLIAAKLGKTLVINDMDFDAVITSVQTGVSDIGMAGLTVNADRAKEVDFSNSYIDATQVVIVKAGNEMFKDVEAMPDGTDAEKAAKTAAANKVISDKNKIKIGAQKGTTGYMYAKGNESFEYAGFPNAVLAPYNSGNLAIVDLINGNLDIVILDKLPAQKLVLENNR